MSLPLRTAKPGDRVRDQRLVHPIDLDAMADGVDQRHGQLAAEVLLELLEAAQDRELPVAVARLERVRPQAEAELRQQAAHAPVLARRQEAGEDRVAGIERDADGDRLAMADPVPG